MRKLAGVFLGLVVLAGAWFLYREYRADEPYLSEVQALTMSDEELERAYSMYLERRDARSLATASVISMEQRRRLQRRNEAAAIELKRLRSGPR